MCIFNFIMFTCDNDLVTVLLKGITLRFHYSIALHCILTVYFNNK